MTRAEVEEIMGPPDMAVPMAGDSGHLLVWEAWDWEAGVYVDHQKGVFKKKCKPAYLRQLGFLRYFF